MEIKTTGELCCIYDQSQEIPENKRWVAVDVFVEEFNQWKLFATEYPNRNECDRCKKLICISFNKKSERLCRECLLKTLGLESTKTEKVKEE